MKHSSKFLMTTTLVITIFISACSSNNNRPRPPRACDGLAAQMAHGHNAQELATSRRQIENQRMGCNQGNQFLILFTTHLFQSTTAVTVSDLARYGQLWCQNTFNTTSVPQQNPDKLRGCLTGIQEGIHFNPGINTLLTRFPRHTSLATQPTTPSLEPSQTGLTIDQAFNRAQAMLERLILTRNQMELAQAQINRAQRAERTLSQTQTTLHDAETEALNTETWAVNLRAHQAEIMTARNEALNTAHIVETARNEVASRIAPLRTAYSIARAAELTALSSVNSERARLSGLQNRLSSANQRERHASSQAADYRSRQRNL